METKDMVRMANQIGDYFRGYGEDQATKEIAYHINSFWEPRMRQMFFKHIEAGGEGLSELVKKAAEKVNPPKEAASAD